MRWRTGALVAVLVTTTSLFLWGGTASAASRYAFADSCEALQVGGASVNRTTLGYAVGGGGEPFYMKASGLGTYLLHDSERRYLSTPLLGNAIARAAQPGPATDWELSESGEGFTIANVGSGRALAVDGSGRLIQSNGQGATFVLRPAQGCAALPEIGTQATGTPWTGASPYAEVEGTIDGHNHVTAYEFLGGDAHCGEPWSRYGVAAALVDCPDHYPNGAGALLENVLFGNPVRTHDPVGWPTFKDWPAPSSMTH